MLHRVILIVLLSSALGGIVGCGGDDKKDTGRSTAPAPTGGSRVPRD